MRIALLPVVFTNRQDESSHITTISLAKQLQCRGHEVCIVSGFDKRFPREYDFEGIKVYRGPNLGACVLNNIFSALFCLKQLESKNIKFDIIHSSSASRSIALRLGVLRLLYKRPNIIHTIKGYPISTWGTKFDWALNFADIVTVPTKNLGSVISKRGCKKEKIYLVRSSINTKKFRPKRNTSNSLGIKKKFILQPSSSYDRGTEILIKSFATFLKGGDLILVIIMRCDHFSDIPQSYKDLVLKLGLKDKVKFITGSIKNMEDYMASAEVVALPYLRLVAIECVPSVILESMACKTLVITTAHPDIEEVAINNKDAIIIPPNDAKALGKALIKVLGNKILRKKLIQNGYKKSMSFNDEHAAEEFIKLYKKLQKKAIRSYHSLQ